MPTLKILCLLKVHICMHGRSLWNIKCYTTRPQLLPSFDQIPHHCHDQLRRSSQRDNPPLNRYISVLKLVHPRAFPSKIAFSNGSRLRTGSAHGWPLQTGQIWIFAWRSSNSCSFAQRQKSLFGLLSLRWTSSQTVSSYIVMSKKLNKMFNKKIFRLT